MFSFHGLKKLIVLAVLGWCVVWGFVMGEDVRLAQRLSCEACFVQRYACQHTGILPASGEQLLEYIQSIPGHYCEVGEDDVCSISDFYKGGDPYIPSGSSFQLCGQMHYDMSRPPLWLEPHFQFALLGLPFDRYAIEHTRVAGT